jgi:hypothetical protein
VEAAMDVDDLLRTRAEAAAGQAGIPPNAVTLEPDVLYALLAARVLATGGTDDQVRSAFDTDDLLRSETSVSLGRRIFARWSLAMHAFLCDPGAEDRQLRDRMLNAILAKDGGGVAVVAGGLVAAFGMSPAVAAIVAALAVKLIVAPAAKELCKTWGDALANEIGSKS